MRIIGTIPHPVMKITVFKMDNKLSVKFETGLYEQTYKFRETGELNDFESVQQLVDGQFAGFVMEQFGKMHRAKQEALGRLLPPVGADEFEVII